MIPLYGFLEGDTIGLLVLAYETDTMERLGEKLKQAASVRVRPRPGGQLVFRGKFLDPRALLEETELTALDRIDLRWETA